jgi:hypothetical protein
MARARAAQPLRPRELSDLANVGPATLADFRTLGIGTVAQLARQDAFRLYDRLCRRTAVRHDPCCIDVFLSAIDQAKGNPPQPWWAFTAFRKQALAARDARSSRAARSRARRDP